MKKQILVILNRFILPGDTICINDFKGTPMEREILKISFFEDHLIVDILVESRMGNQN
jgi:hypothetical protein